MALIASESKVTECLGNLYIRVRDVSREARRAPPTQHLITCAGTPFFDAEDAAPMRSE